MLHGARGDHRIWADRAAALAEDYRVIVPDVRGHGRTGESERSSYGIPLFADDLHALTTELELNQPVVCGLSMGGMIAQTYADRYPDSLSGLCVIGSAAPEVLTRGQWIQFRLVLPVVSALRGVADPERVLAAVNSVLERIYGEEASGDLDEADRIQRDYDSSVPEMRATEREKVTEALTSYYDVTIDYETFDVPALVMYGEYEPSMTARHAEYIYDRIPDCELRTIPDAGHSSHVDNPEFVCDSIRTFAEQVTAQ
ncbi:alpha/beta hydrolase fold protein [Halosimplex carlsbadense 2-9-1]|uniref:Alpha/beta hydrolase fold protein n=1 Tax=Halosimplex carlsbadense 2-9-1 TaxID=797114 RepID=M0CP17_9EURY|nr:alpha/beta hydrolase fold protein [Halosimplex carlsbadense 2-9-1]